MGISPGALGIMALGSAVIGGGASAIKSQQTRKAKKEAREKNFNETNRAKEEAARAEKEANLQESVRKQKEKARKRTIFAGSGQDNIFSPTLGGTNRNSTLG